jgi:hypothetical protein
MAQPELLTEEEWQSRQFIKNASKPKIHDSVYSEFQWARFMKELDQAGYRIVRKPELLDKGKGTIRTEGGPEG